jgi:threonine/homoserine/homoserine lactone efflux protein
MFGVALISLAVAFSGAVVPGPLFALAVDQALAVGWSAGLWLTVGHMCTELALVVLLRLGLGGVLTRPAVTRGIALVGGAVLLYFAFGMVQTAWHGPLTAGTHHAAMSVPRLIGMGVLLSVSNPYWLIWWGTAGVALIAAQTAKHGDRAWPAFFIGHILGDYTWYIAVTTALALGGAFLSPAVHRGLIGACGVGVAILGLAFLLHPVREWMQRPADAKPA